MNILVCLWVNCWIGDTIQKCYTLTLKLKKITVSTKQGYLTCYTCCHLTGNATSTNCSVSNEKTQKTKQMKKMNKTLTSQLNCCLQTWVEAFPCHASSLVQTHQILALNSTFR